jgi:hypothetical protein
MEAPATSDHRCSGSQLSQRLRTPVIFQVIGRSRLGCPSAVFDLIVVFVRIATRNVAASSNGNPEDRVTIAERGQESASKMMSTTTVPISFLRLDSGG